MSWHIRKFSFISVRWKKKKNLLADIFNKNVWVCSCSLFFLANIAASREAAWALAFRPFSKATLLYRFLFFCLFRNKNGRLPFTFFETEDVLKMIRCWLRKLIFEQDFKLELGWSCWNSGEYLAAYFLSKCNVPEPSSTCLLLLKTPSAVRHSPKNERVIRGWVATAYDISADGKIAAPRKLSSRLTQPSWASPNQRSLGVFTLKCFMRSKRGEWRRQSALGAC